MGRTHCDLNRWTLLFLTGLVLFFGVFLLYPVGYLLKGAIIVFVWAFTDWGTSLIFGFT